MKVFLMFFLPVLIASASQAQEIRGSVINTKGDPLYAVSVKILNTGIATSTDKDGRFRFESLQPGSYQLAVSAAGYAMLVRNVVVARKTF